MNFPKIPFNTNRCFTMAKDKSGCEIYIPVATRDSETIESKKEELQQFLATQPEPELEIA